MNYLNDSETLSGTIKITKPSGTNVTFNTDDTYVNKNIALTLNVQSGSATTPTTTITANPSISVNSSTGVITASNSKTQSVTPIVSAGWISSGTAGTITVNGSNTSQLTTQEAKTYNASTSNQTIAAGKYLTGDLTIRGVSITNISQENVKSGIVAKVGDTGSSGRLLSLTGTFTNANTVSSGQTAATAEEIIEGYSAWVDGTEIKGEVSAATLTEIMNYLNINAIPSAAGVSF